MDTGGGVRKLSFDEMLSKIFPVQRIFNLIMQHRIRSIQLHMLNTLNVNGDIYVPLKACTIEIRATDKTSILDNTGDASINNINKKSLVDDISNQRAYKAYQSECNSMLYTYRAESANRKVKRRFCSVSEERSAEAHSVRLMQLQQQQQQQQSQRDSEDNECDGGNDGARYEGTHGETYRGTYNNVPEFRGYNSDDLRKDESYDISFMSDNYVMAQQHVKRSKAEGDISYSEGDLLEHDNVHDVYEGGVEHGSQDCRSEYMAAVNTTTSENGIQSLWDHVLEEKKNAVDFENWMKLQVDYQRNLSPQDNVYSGVLKRRYQSADHNEYQVSYRSEISEYDSDSDTENTARKMNSRIEWKEYVRKDGEFAKPDVPGNVSLWDTIRKCEEDRLNFEMFLQSHL